MIADSGVAGRGHAISHKQVWNASRPDKTGFGSFFQPQRREVLQPSSREKGLGPL